MATQIEHLGYRVTTFNSENSEKYAKGVITVKETHWRLIIQKRTSTVQARKLIDIAIYMGQRADTSATTLTVYGYPKDFTQRILDFAAASNIKLVRGQ